MGIGAQFLHGVDDRGGDMDHQIGPSARSSIRAAQKTYPLVSDWRSPISHNTSEAGTMKSVSLAHFTWVGGYGGLQGDCGA